jgi:hypothetical protein
MTLSDISRSHRLALAKLRAREDAREDAQDAREARVGGPTFAEFKLSVDRSDRPEDQRPGQWAFTRLYEARPDLADQVRGRLGIDPFFTGDPQVMVRFWKFVEAIWEREPW